MNKELRLDEFVTHHMELEKVNEAFDMLLAGKRCVCLLTFEEKQDKTYLFPLSFLGFLGLFYVFYVMIKSVQKRYISLSNSCMCVHTKIKHCTNWTYRSSACPHFVLIRRLHTRLQSTIYVRKETSMSELIFKNVMSKSRKSFLFLVPFLIKHINLKF